MAAITLQTVTGLPRFTPRQLCGLKSVFNTRSQQDGTILLTNPDFRKLGIHGQEPRKEFCRALIAHAADLSLNDESAEVNGRIAEYHAALDEDLVGPLDLVPGYAQALGKVARDLLIPFIGQDRQEAYVSFLKFRRERDLLTSISGNLLFAAQGGFQEEELGEVMFWVGEQLRVVADIRQIVYREEYYDALGTLAGNPGPLLAVFRNIVRAANELREKFDCLLDIYSFFHSDCRGFSCEHLTHLSLSAFSRTFAPHIFAGGDQEEEAMV